MTISPFAHECPVFPPLPPTPPRHGYLRDQLDAALTGAARSARPDGNADEDALDDEPQDWRLR